MKRALRWTGSHPSPGLTIGLRPFARKDAATDIAGGLKSAPAWLGHDFARTSPGPADVEPIPGEPAMAPEPILDPTDPDVRPVVQRKTYIELSTGQRAQIDATSENVYYRKGEAFETRVQQVAAADGRGGAGVNHVLEGLAANQKGSYPGAAAYIRNTVVSDSLDNRLAYLASIAATPDDFGFEAPEESAFAKATRTETNRQSVDFRVMVGADVNPRFEQPIENDQLTRDVQVGGKTRVDSKYAAEARRRGLRIEGGGSKAVQEIASAAVALGLGEDVRSGLKIALMGRYVNRGHTLAEVLKSIDPALNLTLSSVVYRQITPLTETDIGLIFPDYFANSRFSILLSQAIFPDNDPERQAALDSMPADVRGWIEAQIASPHFRRIRNEDRLQPLLNAGIPRVLLETLSDAQLAAVEAFQGAPLSQASVTTLRGVLGDSAPMLFIVAARVARDNPEGYDDLKRIARVGETLEPDLGGDIEEGHGLGREALVAVAALPAAATEKFGRFDADVELRSEDYAPALAAEYLPGAAAIADYTGTDFGRYTSLLSRPRTPAIKPTGEQEARFMNPEERVQLTARLRNLTRALGQLPVYPGTVYAGYPQERLTSRAEVAAAVNQWPPGRIWAPKRAFSTARSVEFSSWIQNTAHIALVLEKVKSGRDIQMISAQATEREVLFPPSARFVVTRTENRLTPADDATAEHAYTGGNFWVYLKEVGSAPDIDQARTRMQKGFEQEQTGRRFIDRAHYDYAQERYGQELMVTLKGAAAASLTAPELVYGASEQRDWAHAARYVQEIKDQDLTEASLQEIHRRAGGTLLGGAAGVYRDRREFAGGGLAYRGAYSALDAAHLAIIEDNPDMRLNELTPEQITGLQAMGTAGRRALPSEWARELTDAHLATLKAESDAGKRIGIVEYAPVGEVAPSMGSFVLDFNRDLAALQGGLPASSADYTPEHRRQIVALAAAKQRKFISIHPFKDGNGRTSRLLMDMVFLHFGQPLSIVADPNLDTGSAPADWAQEVARGTEYTEGLRRKYTGQ